MDDFAGGIRRWEVLLGEGRFVPVRDVLNAEVQAYPSSARQNTAVVLLVFSQFVSVTSERNGMLRRDNG